MKKRLKISLLFLASLLIIYYLFPFVIAKIRGNFSAEIIPATPQSLLVYDTHHQRIGEIVNQGTYRHQFLPLHDTPTFIINAIIALEDQSFRTNDGISRRGLARAIKENIKT
jgi:membrane peptidoglycan carboxypeptidase